VVFSRNEAELLRGCLPLLAGFDEVLVCDMDSSDDTVAVAHAHDARVIDVPVVRVVEAVRQRALDAAIGDWVLFVDADERVPTGFAARVRSLVSGRPEICAWNLTYRNVAFGRTLEHTLVNSAKFALLRRDRCRYTDEERAHLPPIVDGPVDDAPADLPRIEHLSFRSISQGVEKTLRYADGFAADPSVLEPLGFLRHAARLLVFSGVWRDGRAGVAVGTITLFGHWYGAALRAQEAEGLTAEVSPARRRALETATSSQRAVIGARDFVRARRHRAPD